jgi:hypothetical protein
VVRGRGIEGRGLELGLKLVEAKGVGRRLVQRWRGEDG